MRPQYPDPELLNLLTNLSDLLQALRTACNQVRAFCGPCPMLPAMTRRLAEVAAAVGVSEATVSRVLNGRPGVAERTRAAVLAALDRLGHQRPERLREERSRLVGLVLPELQNPIFPAFAEAVGGALAGQGFTPVLCIQTAGGASEAEYVDLLLQHRACGAVFVGGQYAQAHSSHEHYHRLVRRGLPTVLINAAVPDLGLPQVSCDDRMAVRQCLGHLLSLGHRRIGLALGPPDHVPSRRKLAAARQVLAAAGLPLPAELVEHALFSPEGGQAAARRLIARGATGIVCASDPLALGAVRAARRAGLRVPGQVSVIGYDDAPFMNCAGPPLTTIRQPIEAMGRTVVELLAAALAGSPVSHQELLFEPELVVRGTTGPAPRD
ncbi:LacI family DNA-binding transcriptional regulator [Kitasatospora sp. NPDC006697]|uniref:LacI family DNA-binding transcriptional regulator n=1 Tax=Kitasatospora sp. NPDC006697 TaxID=3364020 RepID=UPI00367459B5